MVPSIVTAILLSVITLFSGIGSSISHDFVVDQDSSFSTLISILLLFVVLYFALSLFFSGHYTSLNILPILCICTLLLYSFLCDNLNGKEFTGSFFFLGMFAGSLIAIHPKLRLQFPQILTKYICLSWASVLAMSLRIPFIPGSFLQYSDHYLYSGSTLYFGLFSSDGIFLNNNTLSAISVTVLSFLISCKKHVSYLSKNVLLIASLCVSYLSQNATLALFSIGFIILLLSRQLLVLADLKIPKKYALFFLICAFLSPSAFLLFIEKLGYSGVIKISTLFNNFHDLTFQSLLFGGPNVYSESTLFDLGNRIGFILLFIILSLLLIYTYNYRNRSLLFQPYLFFLSFVILILLQNSVLSLIPSLLLGAALTLPLSSIILNKTRLHRR